MELQSQLNKQKEVAALAKEQEKLSREAQVKIQKLYENARRDAEALPRIQAQFDVLKKEKDQF